MFTIESSGDSAEFFGGRTVHSSDAMVNLNKKYLRLKRQRHEILYIVFLFLETTQPSRKFTNYGTLDNAFEFADVFAIKL
jgi:hypothetical protein